MFGPQEFFGNYLDETHIRFYENCRRFAETEIAPYAMEWEEAGEFPRELYLKAARSGLLGTSISENYGGGGGDIFHGMLLCEAMLWGKSTGVLSGLNSLGISAP